jgi:hypothetical protein
MPATPMTSSFDLTGTTFHEHLAFMASMPIRPKPNGAEDMSAGIVMNRRPKTLTWFRNKG